MDRKDDSRRKGLALVTGAAHRIGKAIAEHLAARGWDLALHYNRSTEQAAGLAASLLERHPGLRTGLYPCDLADGEEVLQLIPRIAETLGPPSLLVNNASVFLPGTLAATTPALLRMHMAVNLEAPLLLTRSFAQVCRRGQIINVADTRIVNNKSGFAAYSLSKKGLWELTRMAAAELGPSIRVNALAPGLTLPPEGKDESYLQELARSIPMKKPVGLVPLLQSIDFMLNNEFLTGQLIFCDGGENLV